MENTMKLFLIVTQRIFSNWTALKLAVEHGMGTKDRAEEFCRYMMDVLFMNDDLTISDVAAVLEDYVAEYFSTYMEDGSAAEVAEMLLKFHQYCIQNEESVVKAELEKLPPLQPWLLFSQPITVYCSDSRSPNEDMNTNKMDMNEDEEGWTTVRRR